MATRTSKRVTNRPARSKPAPNAAQVALQPRLALALAQASVAAYQDFERQPIVPPADYKVMARWTGWDSAWPFNGTEERYGLLFQSTLPGAWKTFIFAFRGTDSDMDAYEDAWFDTTAFAPTSGKVSPTPYVASGFYSVYDTKGGAMKASMRQQLFALIAQHKPRRIYITGHSLGGALCQLFALDVAVSRPALWAATQNFASPMVGTDAWHSAYEAQAAQKDPERRTIRVYNYMDWVPTLPPSLFNYRQVGAGFRTDFDVIGAHYPHLLSRHSILNLQTVLSHAVWATPQVWTGTFQDASDPANQMQSSVPPAGADVPWADRLAAYMRQERNERASVAIHRSAKRDARAVSS